MSLSVRAGRRSSLLSCVFLLVSTLGWAQSTGGSIQGAVKDESAGVLPGAAVTVKNAETGVSRTIVTDSRGAYVAHNLTPGRYDVTAELAGFKTMTRRGIGLSVGDEVVIDLTLSVGAINENVVVTSDAPLVETTSSGISGVVDSQQIREMPLNGRDFIQLSTLQMGVTTATTGDSNQSRGFGVKLSIGGARPSQNRFLLDGSDINDTAGATPGSAAGVMLGVDTLREFRVLTNAYSAEYGKAAGGVVLAVTKSGTNEFHGTAFEFLRDSRLDAPNFFDEGDPPPFRRNQFGFSLGGPIVRQKTFFFGSFEALRERLGLTTISRVPDAATRASAAVTPVIRPYLALYPLPNGRVLGGGIAEFVTSVNNVTNEDFATVRVDQNFGADNVFVRYSFDKARRVQPNPLQIFENHQTSRYHYVTGEHTHLFSSRLLNTARIAVNRNRSADTNRTLRDVDKSLFFVPSFPQLGGISVTGMTLLSGGGDSFSPRVFQNTNVDVMNSLTYDRGAHSLKVGVGATRYFNDNNAPYRPGGLYAFTSLANFLAGRSSRLESTVPGVSDTERHWSQWLFGTFVQDDWKATSNITVNLGLRYEFITVPKERDGKSANLINVPMDMQTTVGPLFENPSLKNFAPRLGVVWAPGQSTAVRAGFGMFYDQLLSNFVILPGSRVPPFWVQANPSNPTFPDFFQRVSLKDIDPRIDTLPYDPDQPYRMQYNVSVQREVWGRFAVTAGYVGSRGVNMTRAVANANPNLPDGTLDGRLFFPATAKKANPVWASIRYRPTDGSSFYNSLLVGIANRGENGLQFQANYSLGKSIDDSSSVYNEQEFLNTIPVSNIFDPLVDRGLSDYDVRQNLTANFVWELPFQKSGGDGARRALAAGWQVAGIVRLSAGSPFTAVLGYDRARVGAPRTGGGQRPDLASGGINPVVGGPDQYFDPSGFTLPPAGTFGNLGRNTLIGPGIVNFDLSFVKNTLFGGQRNIQLRADVFNIFNRANFSMPDEAARTVFSASGPVAGAGRLTSTVTTARQIQFGLKFIF